MPVDRDYWYRLKKRFYERMVEDRYIGYLDPGIEEVLEKIFRLEEAFPTSSCSGRIYAVDSEYPWSRRGSHVFFKKHDTITLEELRSIVETPALYSIWLVVSGPIIHINTLTASEAYRILRVAREAGFKHSGVLSRSRRGYIVEVLTGIRLDILVKTREKTLVPEDSLPLVLEKVNKAYLAGRERLSRLSRLLERLLEEERSQRGQ